MAFRDNIKERIKVILVLKT